METDERKFETVKEPWTNMIFKKGRRIQRETNLTGKIYVPIK